MLTIRIETFPEPLRPQLIIIIIIFMEDKQWLEL